MLCFIGCAPRLAPTPNAAEINCRQVVVIVPGYKGTALEDERGDIRWVSVSEILLGHRGIPLKRSGDDVLQPVGVLRAIPLFLGIDFYDAYDSTLNPLEETYTGCVIPFSYDWRASNEGSAAKLRSLVEEIKSRGAEQIVVVGHSMGGVVVTLLLRDLAERPSPFGRLVDGAVLAGVPFRGTVFVLRDFYDGVVTGVNRSLLTPEAVHTFEAAYELLPVTDHTTLVDGAQRPGPSIADPDNWDRYRWDSCRAVPSETVCGCRDERERGLTRSAEVHEKLLREAASSPATQIPVLVIRGVGTKTLSRGISENGALEFPKNSQGEDPHYSFLFEDGDGTITTESATATPFLKSVGQVDQIDVKLAHDRLISLEPGRSLLAGFISRIFKSGRGDLARVTDGERGDHAPDALRVR